MKLDFNFVKACKETEVELDGVVSALGGKYFNPKRTIVTYLNGDIIEYEIEGSLRENSIPNKENVTKVKIGNTVTSLGTLAFAECSNLTSVMIPNSVTSIEASAFTLCSALTFITIPNSIISIKIYAFSGCTELMSITIPNSVTSIGSAAFSNCPATVTFEGKDKATVQGMANFRWGIGSNKIICTNGRL